MTDVANSANTLGVNGSAAPNGVAPDGTGTSLPDDDTVTFRLDEIN